VEGRCIDFFSAKTGLTAMNKPGLVLGTIAALLVTIPATTALAQQTYPWAPGSEYNRMYDPANETTLEGTVSTIELFWAAGEGTEPGVRLRLETEQGNRWVHLGPTWFVNRQTRRVQRGRNVQVVGAEVTFEGNSVVMARQVTQRNFVFRLRSPQGRVA
jgi:hypothetical protein